MEVTPHVEFLEARDLPPKIRALSSDLTNGKIAMAYVRLKGFQLLAKSLHLTSTREFRNTGLRLKFLVGLSEKQFVTDHEPLQHLVHVRAELGADSQRLQIRYFNDPRFHPKMFMFTGGKRAALLIGSSNITKGGLGGNKEANLLLEEETDYVAMQNATDFFDQLWDRARKLTKKALVVYKQDKEEYKKTKPTGFGLGRLPRGGLPLGPFPKKEELHLYIEGVRYPLSKVHSYCSECGRSTPIPGKWLKWWKCSDHGEGHFVLRKRAKTETNLVYSGRKIRGIRKVEGECLYKLKDGTICGERFSLVPDFSHQICRRCFEKRKLERKPCARIPRTQDLSESLFYDTNKRNIIVS